MNHAELAKTFAGIINDSVSSIELPKFVKEATDIDTAVKAGGYFYGVMKKDFLNAMRSVIIYEIEEVVHCVGYDDLSEMAGSIRGRAEAWYKDGAMTELFGQGIYEILCRLADVLDPNHKARTIKPKTEKIKAEIKEQRPQQWRFCAKLLKPVQTKPTKPAEPSIALQKLEPAQTAEQSPQPKKVTAAVDSSTDFDEKLEKLADNLLAFYEEHGTVIDEETWKFLPDFSKILRDAGFNDSIIKTNASYIRADISDKNKLILIQTLKMMFEQQKEDEETATPTQSSPEAYS